MASNSSATEALVESISSSGEEAQPIIQFVVHSEPTAAATPVGEPEKIEEQLQKLVEDTNAEADLETKEPADKKPTKAKVG